MYTLFGIFTVLWTGIIVVETVWPQFSSDMQWGAITLWSIETIPQIFLNLKKESTDVSKRKKKDTKTHTLQFPL
jgi:hypothetical protein